MLLAVLALAIAVPACGLPIPLAGSDRAGSAGRWYPWAGGAWAGAYPGAVMQNRSGPSFSLCNQAACEVKDATLHVGPLGGRGKISALSFAQTRAASFVANSSTTRRMRALYAKYQLFLGYMLLKENTFGGCETTHWSLPYLYDLEIRAPRCPVPPGPLGVSVDVKLGAMAPHGVYTYQVVLSDTPDHSHCVVCAKAQFTI